MVNPGRGWASEAQQRVGGRGAVASFPMRRLRGDGELGSGAQGVKQPFGPQPPSEACDNAKGRVHPAQARAVRAAVVRCVGSGRGS
jgi:hypothetical protein